MISDSAKRGLSEIFTQAACSSFPMGAGDPIRVEALQGGLSHSLPGKQLLVLTIANFSFRVLTIFHVEADDPAIRAYFSKPEADLAFADVFPEVGNLCCGAMNRELGKYFVHLGMSTPYQLDQQCLSFIDVLKPGHVAQHRIVIGDDIALHATLCLRAYAPIDFRYEVPKEAIDTGCLELF